jgi:hypothetical protein
MWGNGGIAPPFLSLALHGVEWSVSLPGRLTPMEIASCTICIEGCVDPNPDLDAVKNCPEW